MKGHGKLLFAILCGSLVQFQVDAELTCAPGNTSVIGVTFDGSKNQTGDWQNSVVLSKRGIHVDKDNVTWNIQVGYQPVHCAADSKDTLSVRISLLPFYTIDSKPTTGINNSKQQPRNPEYTFFPGFGYYKYHPNHTNWHVAKKVCEREGAHLLVINSQQEADALKPIITGIPMVYVGLIKPDAKGEFVTVIGTPISSTGYSNWYPEVDPENAAATSVGILLTSAGKLGYSFPTNQYPFICEQDL